MPALSDPEKERIREVEIFKDGIRRELGKPEPPQLVSSFFSHPAVLLILGFFLTGYVGAKLTDEWKAREWDNQQRYLARQRALEKKYAVVDEAFRAVAETNTAVEDILAGYRWSNWKTSEVAARRAAWLATSRSWRVSSKVVRQKLGIYFSAPEVQATFDQIIDLRRQQGVIVTNLLNDSMKSAKELETERDRALALVNQTGDLLKQCGQLMSKEITQK
jgi:hypothetical protein